MTEDPRGTCPRCGSREVVHRVFGMLPPDGRQLQPWQRPAGCTVPLRAADRVCQSCGHEWSSRAPLVD